MHRYVALLLLSPALLAKEIPIASPSELKTSLKSIAPGDTLVLHEGEWHDAQLQFKAEGTPTQPITLRAASLGKTILTGESRIQMSGHHLVVEGLAFDNPGQASGEVIELRTAYKDLAYNCTVRDCSVICSKPIDLGKKTSRFCSLYGTGNTIERCQFEGKTTGGTTLVVWLTPGGEGRHVIRENYFGPRPALGENGGETIRLGDSETHDQNARCEVVGNLFERCNGEGEIVSVKSCENRLANNTFLECEGALTLRHAFRCIVEDNMFIGNHKKLTGGVRIVGEDHIVRRNWIENSDGDGYRAAICFMNAIPNTTNAGYQQVKRALLDSNVVINAKQTMLIGMMHDKKCTLPPVDCLVKNNIFISEQHQLIHLGTAAPDWKWENNVMIGKSIGIPDLPGIQTTMPSLKRPTPLERKDVGPRWSR